MATVAVTATFNGTQDSVDVTWGTVGASHVVTHSVSPTDGSVGILVWLTNHFSNAATVNVGARFSGTITLVITDAPSVAPWPTPALPLDLTQPTLPPGMVAARSGATVYAATSATVVSTTTIAVYENRGDDAGGGWWSFDTFSNQCTAPFNHTSGSEWHYLGPPTVTIGATTAPDGTTTGDQITAVTAGQNNWIYRGDLSTIANRVHSAWVKDASPAPSSPGGLNLGPTGQGVNFGSGAAWRRVHAWSNNAEQHGVFPAGFDPWTGIDNTKTGSVYVWGDSEVNGLHDVPLVSGGSSGVQTISTTNTGILSSIITGGDLALEGSFIARLGGDASYNPADCYVFSMQTPDGACSFRYVNSTSQWILAVRGVDVDHVTMGGWPDGKDIRFRVWYKVSTSQYRIQLCVNGEAEIETSGATTGTALSAPTSLWLGSNLGASGYLFGQWTRLATPPAIGPLAAEFVVLGDSISANYVNAIASTSAIYTVAEARTRAGIFTNAVVGDTISGQTTKYQASPYYGASSVKAFVCMAGINDVALGHSAATIEADLTAMFNAIRTGNPTAKIIMAKLTPCKASLTSPQYTVWQTVNAWIVANSLGADAVCQAASDNLNDGTDNILTKYQYNGVHPNNPGRAQIGAGWRTTLHALGLI